VLSLVNQELLTVKQGIDLMLVIGVMRPEQMLQLDLFMDVEDLPSVWRLVDTCRLYLFFGCCKRSCKGDKGDKGDGIKGK